MKHDAKIYVAGHRGLVGSAIVRRLEGEDFTNLISCSHSEVNLERQVDVEAFFQKERPEYVFLAAAKVGGIWANNIYPAEFIYKNLVIQTNVIHAAWKARVKRLLFMGSSCIYPRECSQPMKEKDLLTGPLEPTNEPYAVAKIAGIKMCQSYNRQYNTNFLAVMPTNLYGPNDNFDLETSHALPALIRKFHEAKVKKLKEVEIWGTGKPMREFLHVDDLAAACTYIMNLEHEKFYSLITGDSLPMINIGCGKDMSIKELAFLVKDVVEYDGEITFDLTKPDGMPQKLLDISMLKSLGWFPRISLMLGIKRTYAWCLENSIF